MLDKELAAREVASEVVIGSLGTVCISRVRESIKEVHNGWAASLTRERAMTEYLIIYAPVAEKHQD